MKLRLLTNICLVAVLCWAGYLGTQQPKVWFNRQWAGVALYRGGYRSWHLSFCDGFTVQVDGLLGPVVFKKNGEVRSGYYLLPKFGRADARPFLKGEIVPEQDTLFIPSEP